MSTHHITDNPEWRQELSRCLETVQPGDSIRCATAEQYDITTERVRQLHLGGEISIVNTGRTSFESYEPGHRIDADQLRRRLPRPIHRRQNWNYALLPSPRATQYEYYEEAFVSEKPAPKPAPIELRSGDEVVICGYRCRIDKISMVRDYLTGSVTASIVASPAGETINVERLAVRKLATTMKVDPSDLGFADETTGEIERWIATEVLAIRLYRRFFGLP